jgi:hypothetical protein
MPLATEKSWRDAIGVPGERIGDWLGAGGVMTVGSTQLATVLLRIAEGDSKRVEREKHPIPPRRE